jgi:hypothetical protein
LRVRGAGEARWNRALRSISRCSCSCRSRSIW